MSYGNLSKAQDLFILGYSLTKTPVLGDSFNAILNDADLYKKFSQYQKLFVSVFGEVLSNYDRTPCGADPLSQFLVGKLSFNDEDMKLFGQVQSLYEDSINAIYAKPNFASDLQNAFNDKELSALIASQKALDLVTLSKIGKQTVDVKQIKTQIENSWSDEDDV